ncbi:hypothetical protein BBP40_001012 [Aspergillus hancockii]|nr:hypothetical protein BBP40_001012 [Aspergillus hancockii]
MTHHPPLLHLLSLVSLITTSVYSSPTCYWPDGTPATADVPCSDEKNAPCCLAGNLCLSNNLCLNVAIQPYVLSRGACTDPNWDSDNSEYFCNEPVNNRSKVVCPASSGNAFFVADGALIAGYAALANVSSLIRGMLLLGAGVGVPLGVIAVAAVAWALFERKRTGKRGAIASVGAVATPGVLENPVYAVQQQETQQWKNSSGPVELNTSSRTHELPS